MERMHSIDRTPRISQILEFMLIKMINETQLNDSWNSHFELGG
jgi:hypothetical protein